MGPLYRNVLVAAIVVLLHVAALWALQAGLLRRRVEVVVPVAIVGQLITPPTPKAELPPAPPPKRPPPPVRQPVPGKVVQTPPPARRPAAITDTTPSPNSPAAALTAQPPAAPSSTPLTSEAVLPPAPSVPGKIDLPSSDASYLHNPAPVYPPISKRLGEQGKVLVRVLIGPDGAPRQAELKRSSGFDRLDQSALEYVMKCRYVPGKVDGVPQAMWYEAPVSFVLE